MLAFHYCNTYLRWWIYEEKRFILVCYLGDSSPMWDKPTPLCLMMSSTERQECRVVQNSPVATRTKSKEKSMSSHYYFHGGHILKCLKTSCETTLLKCTIIFLEPKDRNQALNTNVYGRHSKSNQCSPFFSLSPYLKGC